MKRRVSAATSGAETSNTNRVRDRGSIAYPQAAGASEAHADIVAGAIDFAHLQGKLNQGPGLDETIDIALCAGCLDIDAVPEVISEAPAWAVVDDQRSSGYYALDLMVRTAIEKARSSGIAIVYAGSHNDAGSFLACVYKAFEQDMMANASNNSVPLTALFGGMQNLLSCLPFDAITPTGEQPPIWASPEFAEFYDAHIAEAVQQNKPMKGVWRIDPQTGKRVRIPGESCYRKLQSSSDQVEVLTNHWHLFF